MIIRESTGLRNERIKAGGSSLADAMANGRVKLYSGSIPSTGDSAIDGTELCDVTESSLAFTPGTATNGLNLDAAASGTVSKATGETWSGDNVAPGTASYGVLFGNSVADNVITASTTAKRIIFDVSTSGAFLNMSSTALVSGEATALTAFDFTQPE